MPRERKKERRRDVCGEESEKKNIESAVSAALYPCVVSLALLGESRSRVGVLCGCINLV